MGERLTFKCLKDGERIAMLYFHWSGYTQSIYYEAARIVDGLKTRGYDKTWTKTQIIKALHDILYEGGGGIDCWCAGVEEIQAFKNLGIDVPTDRSNRTDGLIAITKIDMDSCEYWSEHPEIMDFDSDTFTNSEFEFIERSGDEDSAWVYHLESVGIKLDDIPLWDPPEWWGTEIPFDKAGDALNWYNGFGCNYILGKSLDGNTLVFGFC